MTENCTAETKDITDITTCDVHIPVDSGAQGEPAVTESDPAVVGMWKLGEELSTGQGTPVVVHTELPILQVASASFAGALVGVLIVAAIVAVLRRRRRGAQQQAEVSLPDGGDGTSPVVTVSDQPSPTEEEK